MSNDLFFIPLIESALREPDPREALRVAFDQIVAIRGRSEYERGYEQFLRFLKAMEAAPCAAVERPGGIEVLVECDGVPIPTERPGHAAATWIARGCVPGTYRIRTDTGWTLWEVSLTSEQLMWAEAHRDQDLHMAADSVEVESAPSMELSLLDRNVTLQVFPGLDGGTLMLRAGSGSEGLR